jgi:hypothetical protein
VAKKPAKGSTAAKSSGESTSRSSAAAAAVAAAVLPPCRHKQQYGVTDQPRSAAVWAAASLRCSIGRLQMAGKIPD